MMPYKSDKQRRYMHAKHPEIAKRWDKEMKNPVVGKAAKAAAKKAVAKNLAKKSAVSAAKKAVARKATKRK